MAQKNDKARLFEKWPDPLGPGETITCAPDECAVLQKWGTNHGTLGPGRHASPDPDVEVFFVRTSPLSGERASGDTGRVKDKLTEADVSVNATIEYTFRAFDASKLIASVAGGVSEEADDDVRQWTSKSLLDAVKRAVVARGSVLAAIGSASSLEGAVIDGSRAELQELGIELVSVASIELSLSAEDAEKINAVVHAKRVAKLEASLAEASVRPPPLPESQPQMFAATPAMIALRVGRRVVVPWSDGNTYPGTIRSFQNGYFEVVWDSTAPPAWLLPHQIQPA